MKSKNKILIWVISLLLLFACDYKKTHVTNIIHKDGSVTRKVTVETNTSKNLNFSEIDVPMDSTWQIKTEMKINKAVEEEEDDTVWYFTAEKQFRSVDELNDYYRIDIGANRDLKRSTGFSKRFNWFNTVYRYSERVEKILTIDCPLSDYLDADEINFVYLPDKVQGALKNGPDSSYYKNFESKIEPKLLTWFWTSEIRQWIEVFYDLFGNDPDLLITKEDMLAKEPQLANLLVGDDDFDDEMLETDSLFISVLGNEFYTLFKQKIESSLSIVDQIDHAIWTYSPYDIEIQMPGKIIDTNGYAITDSSNGEGILWTIKGECFLTQSFEMWAESRVNNYFLWILTALFTLFVFAGFVRFGRKKSN